MQEDIHNSIAQQSAISLEKFMTYVKEIENHLLDLKDNLNRLSQSSASDDLDDYQFLLDEIADDFLHFEQVQTRVNSLTALMKMAVKHSNDLLEKARTDAEE